MLGDILFVKYSRADRIVNIVVDICDTVGKLYNLSFQRKRLSASRVVKNGISYLHGKIKVFQLVRHTQGLLVVQKTVGAYLVKCTLTRMTEGCVTEIVAQSGGFCQVFVKPQIAGEGAGYLRHLKSVGKTGAVMVPLGSKKYLHFVHKPAEGFRVYYLIAVTHKIGAGIIGREGFKSSRRVFGKKRSFAKYHFLALVNLLFHVVHSLAGICKKRRKKRIQTIIRKKT
jgi:hypothetical protein